MTNDELRALADALQHDTDELRNLASGEITAADEAWFAMHDKAIDYLRACAEAQPVPAGWKLVPVEPTPEMLQAGASIMDFDRSGWYDADVSRAEYRAMLAAAPTVPQAEPCIGNDSACPCQDGDACHYKDSADGTKAWPVPQAEPKREPLSEEQMRAVLIAEARWIAAQAGEKDPDSLAVDEEMLAQVMLAGRAVERAHGIGGGDAE